MFRIQNTRRGFCRTSLLNACGSTDGTVELFRKINNNRFYFHFNKENKGLNAYKKLLNSARNDYILIIDDDVIDFPLNLKNYFGTTEYVCEIRNMGDTSISVVSVQFFL